MAERQPQLRQARCSERSQIVSPAAVAKHIPGFFRLIANRTQLANAIRGYANEFGVSAAKGLAHIPMLLERIQADATVPELAHELFMSQAEEYAQLEKKIADVEAKVKGMAA